MIESNSNIVRYDGDGVADDFDYPFLIFQASDLVVYVDDAVISNSAYTVSGVGLEDGGTVTFTSPPSAGTGNVVLQRVVAFTQPVSIPEGEKFPASVVEAAQDRTVMLTQQLDERITRCIRVNVTNFTSADDLVLSLDAADRAAKVIAFNSTGTGLTVVDGGGAAEAEIFAQAASDSANSAANSAQSASDTLNSFNAILSDVYNAINAAVTGWQTGDMKATWRPSATTGWLLLDDGTIGDVGSGATSRENADVEDLFTLWWNNYDDDLCPVSTGRGASAAADWAATKTIRMPLTVGRALYCQGEGISTEVGVDGDVNVSTDTLTVRSNVDTWITGMPVVFTLASGTITGLTSGSTYYIVRSSSTTVKLASTMLNAQNSTAINITAKSSPVWTITHTYADRELGVPFGEQYHAPKSTEVAPHSHPHSHTLPNVWISGGGANNPSGGGITKLGGGSTGVSAIVTGGGTTYPVSPPGVGCNIVVKL